MTDFALTPGPDADPHAEDDADAAALLRSLDHAARVLAAKRRRPESERGREAVRRRIRLAREAAWARQVGLGL